jgi:hypothetical protein
MSVPSDSETNLVINALVDIYKNKSKEQLVFTFVFGFFISAIFIKLIWQS